MGRGCEAKRGTLRKGRPWNGKISKFLSPKDTFVLLLIRFHLIGRVIYVLRSVNSRLRRVITP